MEEIAILDCGGQYTKVIDRRIRELGVKSLIFPITVKKNELKEMKGIILSGGPNSIGQNERLTFDEGILELNIPILGICYGMQLISDYYGGIVDSNTKKEYGEYKITIKEESPIFTNLKKKEKVLMSHGDSVKEVPKGFEVIATSGKVVAGIGNDQKKIYGFQFHPEVDLTEHGNIMLENFIRKICNCKEEYKLEDRIKESVKNIKKTVGNNNVIVLVSGGVDSAVTTALLLKALKKEQIYAIHVDTGFMRKNESTSICKNLKELGLENLIRINAKRKFLNATIEENGKIIGPLKDTISPEDKRRIIGETFIHIVNEEIKKLGLDIEKTFIAQGTLRPDLIESGNPEVSNFAHKIKTHHNDVELVRIARKKGLIIETNSDWHKDEVRKVARMLGLKEEIASREPFPGPGLAIRIICHDKKTEDQILKQDSKIAKSIYEESKIIPIKTVGVQGDARSYKNLCLIKTDFKKISDKTISEIAKKITDQITSINRVGLILNEKNPILATTKNLKLEEENINLLREIDAIVRKGLKKAKVNQTFAVLLPIGITKNYSVAIRAFVTNDFMTGKAGRIGKEISVKQLEWIKEKIEEKYHDKIEYIIYDITSKPPATTEWE